MHCGGSSDAQLERLAVERLVEAALARPMPAYEEVSPPKQTYRPLPPDAFNKAVFNSALVDQCRCPLAAPDFVRVVGFP